MVFLNCLASKPDRVDYAYCNSQMANAYSVWQDHGGLNEATFDNHRVGRQRRRCPS